MHVSWAQLSVQTINVIRVAGLELMRSLIGEFNVEDPRSISIDQFAQEQRSRFLAHILRSSSWQTYAMQCVPKNVLAALLYHPAN